MAVYKTDIDYDFIKKATQDELLDYVKSGFISHKYKDDPNYKFKRRYKTLKALCELLNIQPNPEQWVFLLTDCDRLLCEACAGAGKTTMAQLKLIDEKLTRNLPGKNILSLAYNNHAVKDMKNKHEEIISRINRMGIPDLKRDRDICCHTFHSFCLAWLMDYPEVFKINLKDFLLVDKGVRELMSFSAETYKKKNPLDKIFISDATISALISLYSFTRETLTGDDEQAWKLCTAMTDLKEYSLTTIKEIFKYYEKIKSLKHRMDFTDVVDNMFVLCHNPDVMARIRGNYKIMLVDEYQDITPAMLRVINLIMQGDGNDIEPFHEGKLICIGDGDQSIYGFRGTDPDNCIRFKDAYTMGEMLVKITSMSENRRCPSKIIDVARKIIESNDKRIEKPILSIREGGDITVIQYQDETQQMEEIIRRLKTRPQDDLRNSCICYRNLASSYMLTVKLVESGIPFRIGKGHTPLSDKLSSTLFGVLNMLSYPDNIEHMKQSLFKVLPKSAKFSRDALFAMLATEETQRKAGKEALRFWELPFGPDVMAIQGFADALRVLVEAYGIHRRNGNMSIYTPNLIKLIRVYYLDWQLQKGMVLSEEYLDYLNTWFSRKTSYDNFMRDYRKLMDDLKDNVSKGCYITTMHGLKGLEFEDVFIIDLNDQLFPGTEINTAQGLTQEQKDVVENEARRLFYVAVTRTKDKLTLLFDKECPTRYLRFFKENEGIAKTYESYMNIEGYTTKDGFIVADGSSTNFKPGLDMTELEEFVSGMREPKTSSFASALSAPSDELMDMPIDLSEFATPADTMLDLSDLAGDDADALNEKIAGKPGLIDAELVKTLLAEDLTVEEQRITEEAQEVVLEQSIGTSQYNTVADKPVIKSILAILMEK